MSKGDIHVVPVNDVVEHVESMKCPCRPSRDEEQSRVVIHHSADGREHFERLAVQ